MKRWIWILLLVLGTLQLASGTICEEVLTPGTNCTMLTPAITCNAGQYTYDIFNETQQVVDNFSLASVGDSIYKFEFNQSTGSYIVKLCDASTREIIVKGEDEMASLAITVFILLTVVGLGALPFFVRFSRNEITNLIMKRCCWVLAIYLMMLNSVMMATIADFAGIPLTNELFRYMWLFGVAGYIMMGYTVLKTIFDIIRMYQNMLKDKRMGRNG